MKKTVYLHIPFCKHICSYCDFCKVLLNEEWVNNYLKSLAYEIDDYYEGDEVKAIYIGGGTPSAIGINAINKLLKMTEIFKKSEDCEITFEINIEDVSDLLLQTLKKYQVNRLSIGIQSFNQEKLKLLERSANYDDVKKKLALCHYYGFDNINVDFMYSIGNETLKDFKADLKQFMKLPITHFSSYSLIIEEHTKVNLNHINNVNEELEVMMYHELIKELKKHHFKHYEISNFTLPGYESKHNKNYWENGEYYGFGLGASGYIDNTRYDNTHNLTKYLKNNYDRTNTILTKKDQMDYAIMLGLRMIDGINIAEFNKTYDTDIYNEYPVNALIKNEDLILKKGNIFINPTKLYVMNEILLKMI